MREVGGEMFRMRKKCVQKRSSNLAGPCSSDASLLWRTATVVRQRSDIFDTFHIHTSSLQRRDCAFTPASRPTNSHFKLLYAKLGSFFGSLLGSALARIGRSLTTSLEAARATARPAERVPLGVCNGDCCVVETCRDVGNSSRHTLLFCLCNL